MKAVLRWFACVVSAIAMLIVILLLGSRYLDWGGELADRLLANARAPIDREMPPTAHAVPNSSADIQIVGGQGDELGCSIERWIDVVAFRQRGKLAPISLRMRQACVFHDYCYRHGAATYGYSQADCDYLLLEHTYRICRFINADYTVEKCVRDARKVLLGVRLGGADNFKNADRVIDAFRRGETARLRCDRDEFPRGRPDQDIIDDGCASSYFEFNPYPIRAQAYRVYRIADAPQRSDRVLGKALYVFDIRPSGTVVTIVSWTQDGRQSKCSAYDLPGSHTYLSVPPRVVRASVSGRDQDWLIWWQRFNLDQTGGRLAMIPAARATLKDWQHVFPGAQNVTVASCDDNVNADANDDVAKAVDAKTIKLGKSVPDDPQFSELHPVLPAPQSGLRIRALRTHTCAGVNILCFADFLIDPETGTTQVEPYVVRDEINRRVQGGKSTTLRPQSEVTQRSKFNDGSDPDRYRNFVTPPMSFEPDKGGLPPTIAWLRRGESRGETYRDQALLRRATHIKSDNPEEDGVGLPSVLLKPFPEAADPLIVIDRQNAAPTLVSVQATKNSPKIAMHSWVIPPPGNFEPTPNQDCFLIREKDDENDDDERLSLSACAQATALYSAESLKECGTHLDRSWLIRPPIVFKSRTGNDDPVLIFNRMTTRPSLFPRIGKPRLEVVIEVRKARLSIGQTGFAECHLQSMVQLRVGVLDIRRILLDGLKLHSARTAVRRWQDTISKQMAALRTRPLLVAEFAEGRTTLAVPDTRHPAKTRLYDLD